MKPVIVLLILFVFINGVRAQSFKKNSLDTTVVKETRGVTRIIISTSGYAEFTSHWLGSSPDLVIEFQSKNVRSKIGNEVVLKQGIIKRITTKYYPDGQERFLKSLTFELSQKVPYEIFQEDNAILIDIKVPDELSFSSVPYKEIITQDEKKAEITRRLEEMDKALTRIDGPVVEKVKSGRLSTSQVTTDKGNLSRNSVLVRDLPEVNPSGERNSLTVDADGGISGGKNGFTSKEKPLLAFSKGVKNPAGKKLQREEKMLLPTVPPLNYKGIPEGLFLLATLALFSGLGVLIIRYLKYKWKAAFDSELAKIKSRLQDKEERLNQEEVIRKAIEQAQVQKEKDYNQLKNSFEFLKLELERQKEVLMQKEAVIDEKEQNSLQKEQECQELKKTVEVLKDAIVRRKMIGKFLSSQEEDKPWIPGESAERRELGRLDLSRDYNRTVLLRIDCENKSKTTKCFAGNISVGGLGFESEIEFEEKEILSLRLFFFGDRVPMMRLKAEVVWIKKALPVNYYGLVLLSQEEKNKAELKEYIESHMVK